MGGGTDGKKRATKEGIERDFFKMKMKEAMPHLSMDEINKIVMCVDTRSETHVYWEDFLKFLEHEGDMREIINDMRINQPGITKLIEHGQHKITRSANVSSVVHELGAMPSLMAPTESKSKAWEETKNNSYHVERMLFMHI
jgi:hypothetical protein